MKKILLLGLITLLGLSSCDTSGYDDAKCAEIVKRQYPNCRVLVYKSHYKYLIIDSTGQLSMVVIGGLSAKITDVEGFVEIR